MVWNPPLKISPTIFSSMIVLSPSAAQVALHTKLLGPSRDSFSSARDPMILRNTETESTPKEVPTNLQIQTASTTFVGNAESRIHTPTFSLVEEIKCATIARDSLR